jgi:hypothetical protein
VSEDDEEARRRRAAELHERIERLKSGAPPDEPDRPPTPRELTDESAREELEHEQPDENG